MEHNINKVNNMVDNMVNNMVNKQESRLVKLLNKVELLVRRKLKVLLLKW